MLRLRQYSCTKILCYMLQVEALSDHQSSTSNGDVVRREAHSHPTSIKLHWVLLYPVSSPWISECCTPARSSLRQSKFKCESLWHIPPYHRYQKQSFIARRRQKILLLANGNLINSWLCFAKCSKVIVDLNLRKVYSVVH